MQLIKKWQKAWQLSSVQTAVILGVANAAFALLPALSDVVSLPIYAGVMADCTKSKIKAAHKIAMQNMSAIWSVWY